MKELKGIEVESFAHPDEVALLKGMEKTKFNKLLEWASSASVKYTLNMRLMGRCVRLNERDMPELYALLRDVCRALDYAPIPTVFTIRSSLFDWEAYYADVPVIILTDYALSNFDEGMLRFHLGCAVTALKAKTGQLRTAAALVLTGALVGVPLLGAAAAPFLAKWMRAATLTEDRGGLLACQDDRAAWRYMLRLCGIPLSLIDENIIQDYIAEYKPLNRISGISKNVQTLLQVKPWQNERLIALYEWYLSGAYDDILEDY